MSTSLLSFALIFAVAFIGFTTAQSARCDKNEVFETCWRRRFMPESVCNSARLVPCVPRCRCREGWSRFGPRCIRECPIVRDPRQESVDNSTMPPSNTTMGNSMTNSSISFNETEIMLSQQLIVNLTLSPLCLNGTDGFYPIKDNCSQYVLCVIGTATILDCPKEFVFNSESGQCVAKDMAAKPCGTMESGSGKKESNSSLLQSDKDLEPLCKAKGSNGLFSDPKSCSHAIACLDSKAIPYKCQKDLPYFNTTLLQCTELPEDVDKSCVAQTRLPRGVWGDHAECEHCLSMMMQCNWITYPNGNVYTYCTDM